MKTRLIALLAAPLALSACATLPASAPPPVASAPAYERGMVSAADPRAAEAGAEMLRRGGSATDAAIAVMLALTVVEPQSSGIGGGGLYVTADTSGAVETIDGRETAPKAAHPQWFFKDGKLLTFGQAVPGGTSVGIPGNIALAARAHKAHGRLPWATLFQPAIKLARDGWDLTPRFVQMAGAAKNVGTFTPEGAALFYDAAGNVMPVGTHVSNPALAATFEGVARQGARWFYSGANRRAIVGKVMTAPRNPAPMTEADIAAYQAKDRTPVCGQYRSYKVCGMGPPSSGATTVFATIKQLERFNLAALGPDSPIAWHLIAESMRLAYADRARYSADADFVPVPVAGMIDAAYLASRSALISPTGSMASVSAGTPPGADKLAFADSRQLTENGTSHIVAIDRQGRAVTYTSTIESLFGSGIVVGGYYLNNELTDFDMDPKQGDRLVANRVEGSKRPRSSMSPTLVFDAQGRLRLAVGAAGGATIPAQVIRALIGVLDWNLTPEQALALPVIFAPGGNTVYVEKGSRLEAMMPALVALGHADVATRVMPLKANAVDVMDGKLRGAADPRSEGRAVSE